jgi:hypothetical protein
MYKQMTISPNCANPDSAARAAVLLDVWYSGDRGRLRRELVVAGEAAPEDAAADEVERCELLSGISARLGEVRFDSARFTDEELGVYLGLLRHLAGE